MTGDASTLKLRGTVLRSAKEVPQLMPFDGHFGEHVQSFYSLTCPYLFFLLLLYSYF